MLKTPCRTRCYTSATHYRAVTCSKPVPLRSRHSSTHRAVSSDSNFSPQGTYEEASTSDSTSLEGDWGYMQEYAALKQQLLNNTRKSGGAIGLYLLLTVNGAAALAAMIGTAASYAYLVWLCRDVDNEKPTDTVPVWEANKVNQHGKEVGHWRWEQLLELCCSELLQCDQTCVFLRNCRLAAVHVRAQSCPQCTTCQHWMKSFDRSSQLRCVRLNQTPVP